jgi:hypothetical protein
VPHRYKLALDDRLRQQPHDIDEWLAAQVYPSCHHPRLCHALREAGPRGATPPGEPVDQAEWIDIPWVTLVLGSECLDMQAITLDADIVSGQVEMALLKLGILPEDAARVAQFVAALVRDRIGNRPADAPDVGPGETITPDEWQLRLLEAAATLNDLFFRAKRTQQLSISRWNEGDIGLFGPTSDAGGGRRDGAPNERADLKDEHDELRAVVDGLRERLDVLRDLLEANPRGAPIAVRHMVELVERLQRGLGRRFPTVRVSDVQALTEIAWAALMQSREVYPAWPELLVDLCLGEHSRGLRDGDALPSFTKPDGARVVLDRLLRTVSEATAQGYAELQNDNARDRAYEQYARLLVLQAGRVSRKGRSRTAILTNPLLSGTSGAPVRAAMTSMARIAARKRPPIATAFVTTFDVELEMALRHHHPEQPFVVAVPVHLEDGLDPAEFRATSMWLAYVLRPSDKPLLEAVTAPHVTDWFVLSSTNVREHRHSGGKGLHFDVLPEDVGSLDELPFIVRLSGSPLVKLPDLGSPREGWVPEATPLRQGALSVAFDTGRAGSPPSQYEEEDDGSLAARLENSQLRFLHAPLVEEHVSLRLSLPEVAHRGLPEDLTKLEDQGYRRYWMLLGVQMSDPVIRLRLMAQFFAAGLMHAGQFGKYQRPTSYGVAVNRAPLNARAADLLQYSDFDIVPESVETMTAQLAHYNEHLESDEAIVAWPRNDMECAVGGGLR